MPEVSRLHGGIRAHLLRRAGSQFATLMHHDHMVCTACNTILEFRDDMSDEEASEAPAPINDAPTGPDVLRVSLPVEAALRFAEQALQLAAAGRQPCPNCGAPLDPNGHTCARKAAFLN